MAIRTWSRVPMLVSVVVLLLGVPAGAGDVATGSKADLAVTRAAMCEVYTALTRAFRLSLNEASFGNPDKKDEVLNALRELSVNADLLKRHKDELGQDYAYLRRSLAEDAKDTLLTYQRGRYEESRFILHGMTENCIACHSKLPNGEFDLGKGFAEDLKTAGVLLEDRARIEIATRQFEEALNTYEELFQSKSVTAAQVELSGAFLRYFKVCLRVKKDHKRAIRALKTFLSREDLPLYLKNHTESWIEALEEIRRAKPAGDALQSAEVWIQKAKLGSDFPEDPDSFVYYVEASGFLHRYLASKPKDVTKVARAFFLLGVTESHIGYSYWLSETDHFLESAIRVDPGGPWAQRAYAYLEEFTYAGWTGSSGETLPEDVKKNLDELRTLIDGASEK